MLTGFYILKGGGGIYWTPSFPGGGGSATFSVEVMELIGSPTGLAITVQHKNPDETTWGNAGSFATITSLGVASVDTSGLKQEIRFLFTVTATNSWEGFYLLIAPPSWRPY